MADKIWISHPVMHGTSLDAPAKFAEASRNLCDLGADTRFVDSHFVECVNAEAAQNYSAEWADLASRSLHSNVFLEPSFALPAARHISGAARPHFLLVWESGDVDARGRLVGLWPLVFPRTFFGSTVKAWVHDFCCCGGPLLDKTQAFRCLELMFKWLKYRYSNIHALSASQLAKVGPTCGLLREHAASHGLSFIVVTEYDRAALDATVVGVGASDFVSPKKKKELQRQLRRLGELGTVTFGMASVEAVMRDEIEAFMVLEAKGWKGRRGDAFLNDHGRATFLRAMTRAMGQEGKCRLYWLAIDGRMIAGNIVLLGGSTAYFWKTAYDEDFSFASPGVLLTVNMTDLLLRERHIATADSCAIANHPMIDHIWRGRLRMADAMMSLREDHRAFNRALQCERFRRRLRDKAKSAWAHFRRT